MKSTAHDRMIKGFARMADLNRKATWRNVITRSRHLDRVDWNQIPIKSSNELVDDDGKFFFIVGLSTVGGGDKVRPE